eukprot:6477466-Amphidinium_carterae.2
MGDECPELPQRDAIVAFSSHDSAWVLHRHTGECRRVECKESALHFDTEGHGHFHYTTQDNTTHNNGLGPLGTQ